MGWSLGIDFSENQYRTCLLEQGLPLEMRQFSDGQATLHYVEQVCRLYPELLCTLSAQCYVPSAEPARDDTKGIASALAIAQSEERKIQQDEVNTLFASIRSINLKSSTMPLVRDIPTVPRYRTLNRRQMGFSSTLSALVTLFYRMRLQDAAWTELRFMYLDVDATARKIIIVQDGQIVDGIVRPLQQGFFEDEAEQEEHVLVMQAFWEELTQDMAGLLALHHFEDVVLKTSMMPVKAQHLSSAVIEHLGENYQYYVFPRESEEQEGFESAWGAALVSEGFARPGIAAEVVERLQLPPPRYR